jgi:hypothetical protein
MMSWRVCPCNAAILVNRIGNYPQASSLLQLSDKDFLSVVARERDESVANNALTEALVDAAVQSIAGAESDADNGSAGM